jgi:four helix bundle protein
LNMAYSSLIELVNHLVIATRLGYLDQVNYIEARFHIQAITAMINGLVRSYERAQGEN